MSGEKTAMDDVQWMDRKAVAKHVGITASTLSNWIADPDHPFPKGAKLGNGRCAPRRWRKSVVDAWLVSREHAA